MIDGLEYHEGLNAVFIRGGVAGNVLPDECVVEVNYRFAPDRSEAEAEAFVRDYFDGFDVTLTDLAPGALPGLDRPAAKEFVEAVGGQVQPQVRLDRRVAVHRPRRACRQLRPGRPDAGPQAGGARADRADHQLRGAAADVVGRQPDEGQAQGAGADAPRPGRRIHHRPAAARLPRPDRLGAHRPVAGAADPGRVRRGVRRARRAGPGDRGLRLRPHARPTIRRTRRRRRPAASSPRPASR